MGENGGVLLVRPDGYVGFYSAGLSLLGLSAFLDRLLTPRFAPKTESEAGTRQRRRADAARKFVFGRG